MNLGENFQETLRWHSASNRLNVSGIDGTEPTANLDGSSVQACTRMPLRMPRQEHVVVRKRVRQATGNRYKLDWPIGADVGRGSDDDPRPRLAIATCIRD